MEVFTEFVNTIARLRAPDGCPWDREQTANSLLPYLLEETAEVADSIIRNNSNDLREELGDLLLQIVIHSQIADEKGHFSISDVIRDVNNKMVSRHPHVFGELKADTSDQVLDIWDKVKSKEKKYHTHKSHLDKVPKNFPPLLTAYKYQKAASKVGFDWPDYKGSLAKIEEETAELKHAISIENRDEIESELGDLIFACVNLGRFFDIRPDVALTKTNNKFKRRFQFIEDILEKTGKKFDELSLEELDKIWDKAKESEKADLTK